MRLRVLLAAVLLAGAAACASEAGRPGAPADASAGVAEDAARYDYEAVFSGALTDTLQGQADFGTVVASDVRQERFVIVLKSRDDPLGGLVFSRPDAARPAPGTYALSAEAGAARRASGFRLTYREGMRRTLHATAGTLTLRVVRDTLIEGSFRADLEGTVARPGQAPRQSLADVRGSFRAESGSVGFLLGL